MPPGKAWAVDIISWLPQHVGMKRMSMQQFGEVVRKSVDLLPATIKRHLDNIVIDIEEAPTDDFLRDAGYTDEEIDAGDMPYGYFMPMNMPSEDKDMLDLPNRILIFKFPLEEDFPDQDELMLEIRKTVVHEIAHHFGWSERDLQEFEDDPNPFKD
jgi:predicted Zn-dependent protease with MMP-like domain